MKIRSGLIPLAFGAAVVMAGCNNPSPSPGGTQHYASGARSAKDRYEVATQDSASYGALLKASEITLHSGANRDIGFGALTFAADGALFALTAHDGSLWRIDVATLSANEVELSQRVLDACTLMAPAQRVQSGPPRTMVLCASAKKNFQQIVISPDFTRGQVSAEKCPFQL